jgi:putative nucleotidyltransferase with HDIG domain
MGDPQVFVRIRERFGGLTPRVIGYVALVDAVAIAAVAALIITGHDLGNELAVAGLAVVASYGERGRISLRGHLTVSISLLPAIFAAVLFGPLAAMIVFGASGLGVSFPNMNRWVLTVGRLSYMGSRALTGALAAAGVAAAHHLVTPGAGQVVVASAAAALIAELADAGFASLTFWLRGHGRFIDAAADSLPVIAASVPFYSPAVAILALSYQDVSPWTLPLFFAPALAAQRWFLLYQEQRRLADDLQVANDQLRGVNLSFAKGLIATLDARDRYTAGHSAAVAIYARDIATRMGLSVEDQDLAYLCGLVHDIGKIGLPAGLLEKPGALTLDERREMQRHSEIGEGILANVDTYAEIASIVRHHHERVDGQGYPDGLSADEIPLLSRVIAVADAYNAMTSDRPYREAMPSRVARLRLAQAVENQFDTTIVAAFEAILAGAAETYRLAKDQEFTLVSAAVGRDDQTESSEPEPESLHATAS